MVDGYILPRIATASDPLRLGILISGSGTGLESLLCHQRDNTCAHESVVVISDQPDVLGLKRAQKHAVEAVPVPLLHSLEFESATARRRAHELQVEAVLAEHCVELIVCSGYMRILTAQFLTPRLGRVVNIHPSLWGEDGAIYPGVHGIRDCLTAGETATGASVHFVSIGVDDGPLIASEMITIRSADTEESLAARVRVEIEHRLYPQVIDALAEGRVKSDGIQFHITS